MSWLVQNGAHYPAQAPSSIPALLEEKRNEIETELIHHANEIHKRFVSDADIRQLWHKSDFKRIFPRWSDKDVERIRQLYITIFSILVYIRWWPIDRDLFRLIFLSRDSHTDAALPFTREQLTGLPEPFIDSFVFSQYIFKPCIIRKSRQARVDRMDANQPWPFVNEPRKVGCGGFGEVWEATVAEGCYRNESDQDNMISLDQKVVAFKKFSDGRDYHKEVQSLEYLRESLINHDHIAVHLAAIVHGKNDFYIFFELTPLGDLEILLNGGEEPNIYDSTAPGTMRYDFNKAFNQVRKLNFLEELRNIASALEFLHESLPKTTTLGVFCCHFDLRPANVLVYPRNTGSPNVGKWVLADFGISSFKQSEPGQLSPHYRTMGDFVFDTSRTGPRNLQGTHRAPELHERSDRKRYPGRKCDIWSFGCISTEVLAFMLGGLGEKGVQAAAKARQNFCVEKRLNYLDDYYFEWENPSQRQSKARLRTSVVKWLNRTPASLSQQEPEHADWINQFVALLYRTLKIIPEHRPLASDIVQDLRGIIRTMEMTSDLTPWTSPDPDMYADGMSENDTPTDSTPKTDQTSQLARAIEVPTTATTTTTTTITTPTREDILGTSPGSRVDIDAAGYLSPRPDPSRDDDLYNSPSSHWSPSPSFSSTPPAISFGRPFGHAPHHLPELAVTSSESGGSSQSDAWSVSARHNSSLRNNRTEQTWRFDSQPEVKVFEIAPTGDKAAFISRSAQQQWQLSVIDLTVTGSRCEPLDYLVLPETVQWDRLAVTSRFLVAAGRIGTKRDGCMIDLVLRRPILRPGGWPWPCQSMTPSIQGMFAWLDSSKSVRIWNPVDNTEICRTVKQAIDHICFNTTGTCLLVWARDTRSHYVYTINMLDPTAEPTCTPFKARLSRPANKTSIWSAQSDHACLVQEASSLPRCYIRFDEESIAPPQEIQEATLNLDTSATALCDNFMVTARLVGGPFAKKLRVSKRYYHVSADGKFKHTSTEIVLSESIRIKGPYRLAAYEDRNADTVVICTQNGSVHRFASAPNEQLRQRNGSFLR